MSVLDVIKRVVTTIKKDPPLIELLVHVLGGVFTQLVAAVQGGRVMTEAEIESWWQAFDDKTGLEGVRLVDGMPPEDEENMLDGLRMFGSVLMKWANGHYGSQPSAEDLDAVLAAVGLQIQPGMELACPHCGVMIAAGDSAPDPGKAPEPDRDPVGAADVVKKYVARHHDLPQCLEELIKQKQQPAAFMTQQRLDTLTDTVILLAS